MLGFLAYLPTIAFVPHQCYLAISALLFWRIYSSTRGLGELDRDFTETGNKVNLYILLCFVAGSVANNYLHRHWGPEEFTIPYTLAIPLCFWAGIKLTTRDYKVIVYCIGLECMVAIFESFQGISTIYSSLANYQVFNDTDLLYNRRVLGLSEGSSHLALKVLLGYVLIDYAKMRGKAFACLKALLLITALLTYGRTSLVALTVFLLFSMIRNWIASTKSCRNSVGAIVGCCIVSLLAYFMRDDLVHQFTRDTNQLELSQRPGIWSEVFEDMRQSLFFGNGSYKKFVGEYHAHNSYLQLFSTHGVVLSILYIILLCRRIKRFSIHVITLFVYSLAQYGLFWGISLIDMLLFSFLFGDSSIPESRTGWRGKARGAQKPS